MAVSPSPTKTTTCPGAAGTDITLARFDANGVFINWSDISQSSVYNYEPYATVLSNGMIVVSSTSDSDATWTLVDQNTGAVLGSSSIGSSTNTSVAAMDLGQLAAFSTNRDTEVRTGPGAHGDAHLER